MADKDDLMLEVTGSSEKASNALDKIIAKVTQMQEAIDRVTPSLTKFTDRLNSITAGSKAFAMIDKLTKGTGELSTASKKAEANEAMYQARLDRANVSMARSQAQLERYAAAKQKVAEIDAAQAHNKAIFAMSPEEYKKNGYDHSQESDTGVEISEPGEPTPKGPSVQYNAAKIQAQIAAITSRIGAKGPKINVNTEAATAEIRKMGEYIDSLTPQVSAMSAAAQAQFNAIASKLDLVSQRLDNQRMLYHNLADQSARVAREQGEGSTAYLQLEKRMLSADSAAQRLSATQEKLKAQMADIAGVTDQVGIGMAAAGESSEKAAKKSTSGWSKTLQMFEKMMIRIAAFKVFSAMAQGITTGLQDMALASGQANATMSALATNSLYLKNSIGAALMPALQAIVPVINQVTDALANVFNTIAMLTARIFNHAETVTIARRANVDYAATIDKTGSSASDTSKKVKELQRTVMGFDELNTLQKSADESASTPKNPNPGMPSYGNMFETVKVPGWVDKIGNFTDKIGKIISDWWSGLTSAQKWGAGIGGTAGAVIGGIIGRLIGGPVGMVVGAALGAAAGVAIGKWWASLTSKEKWGAGIGAAAGTTIGAIIGGLIGGKIGAAVGAVLGGVVGALMGKWWADLTTPEKWSAGIGAGAGAAVGGIIGGILTGGNPVGIAIGAALGGSIGGIIGKWWTDFTSADKWGTGAGATAGAVIGGIIGSFVAPGVGTVVGAMLGGVIGTSVSAALIHFNSSINLKPLGDNVSKATQNAVSKFDAFYKAADEDLKQLEWSGDTVTKDMANKVKKNINAMASSTLDGLDKQRTDAVKSIEALSKKGSGITTTEMQKMVSDVTKSYDKRMKIEQDDQNKINKILETASTNHRGLTASESSEIDKLKSDMYSSGIKALSKNQVEEQAIYDNMRVNHTATSAQEAAAIVKSSKDTTDKVVAEANSTYEQKVAAIIRERDETHSISSDEADKLIKAAAKERDDTVKSAEDKHKKVVDEAKKQSGDLVNQVDWQNGTVKSKWTVFWDSYYSTVKKNWGEFFDFFKTTLPKWWNDNIAPWFTKEKWQGLGKQAIDALTSPFKNIHWPHISTPHLSWDSGGWKSTGWIYNVLSTLHLPTQMPKLNVSWYAQGALFTKPVLGFGEAGPEAALPLNNHVFSQIAQGIQKNSGGGTSDEVLNLLRTINESIKQGHSINVHMDVDGKPFVKKVIKEAREQDRRFHPVAQT